MENNTHHRPANLVAAEPTSSYEVVVVGAGQAGLAIGHFLRRHGRRVVILERAGRIAPAWRERWDSLTLFTPRRYSGLPGVPFPGDPDGYPSRDEVIAYLERYAENFNLPFELNSEVKELDRGEDGRFHLDVDEQTITADQVVVAARPAGAPRRQAGGAHPRMGDLGGAGGRARAHPRGVARFLICDPAHRRPGYLEWMNGVGS